MCAYAGAPNLNLSEIFPFGVGTDDTFGPFGDDSFAGPIDLETPFELIGRQYGTIFVSQVRLQVMFCIWIAG